MGFWILAGFFCAYGMFCAWLTLCGLVRFHHCQNEIRCILLKDSDEDAAAFLRWLKKTGIISCSIYVLDFKDAWDTVLENGREITIRDD